MTTTAIQIDERLHVQMNRPLFKHIPYCLPNFSSLMNYHDYTHQQSEMSRNLQNIFLFFWLKGSIFDYPSPKRRGILEGVSTETKAVLREISSCSARYC